MRLFFTAVCSEREVHASCNFMSDEIVIWKGIAFISQIS